jgi:hypothetical protein
VLQVQHGLQHDARAEKAPPCVHSSSSFTVCLFINPPFLQCSKCSMEYNTKHELRKHRRVHGSSSFTVRLFISHPFLQCSKCSMENHARAAKAPPCAWFIIHLQCPCLLILLFTVLQVQHGLQHDAQAEKAPPCVHGSSSFTVRLFINPPFLQCSKCSMEYNTMHKLRKHRCVHGSSSFTVCLFINLPFLQCSKCSMEYNTTHELWLITIYSAPVHLILLFYSAPSAAWSTTPARAVAHHHLQCACYLILLFYSAPSAAWSTTRSTS